MLRYLWTSLRRLVGTACAHRVEQDLEDELRFHLEMEEEQRHRLGTSRGDARRTVRGAFGGVDQIKEALRERRRAMWLEGVFNDSRFALRTLRLNSGYAGVVVLTLALGIGANAAVFAVINGVLLQPLANQNGERIAVLHQRQPGHLPGEVPFSTHDLADYRDQLRSIDAVAEFHQMTFNLLGQGEPEEVATGVVDHEFFQVLGIPLLLGRGFTKEENAVATNAVMVLSHAYWQRRFAGEPILGKTLEMNGRVHTVIGVLAPFTAYGTESEIYVPTSQCPVRSSEAFRSNRKQRMMNAFARLRPGRTLEELRAELALVAGRLKNAFPDAYPASTFTATADSLKEELIVNSRPMFMMLFAAVGLVLLIAGLNVTNLAFARLLKRQGELATRAAIGASRGRLARQVMTESLLLALIGGGAGLAVAFLSLDLLESFAGRFTPRASEIQIDGAVAVFTIVVSTVVGLAVGCAAILSLPEQLFGAVKESAGASIGVRRRRVQAGLVVGQLALAFVLLATTGLIARSLFLLLNVQSGVEERVLTARVVTPVGSYNTNQAQRGLWLPVLERIRQQPGVLSAAVASSVPLSELNDAEFWATRFDVMGHPVVEAARPQAQRRNVTSDYFRTVGVPILLGRAFVDADETTKPRVCIVNQAFVRAYLRNVDPVGARLNPCGPTGPCNAAVAIEIVGVVGDVRHAGLETESIPEIYLPSTQTGFGPFVLVRSAGSPLHLSSRVARLVHEVDPHLPVEGVQTISMVRAASLAPRRLTAIVLAVFAAIALVVTLAGIGGITAFEVGQRQQEIGVRMALGATRGQVRGMILWQSLRLVATGLMIGLVVLVPLSGTLRRFVWGIQASDAITLATVAIAFLAVSAVASLLPARRATVVDPTAALRSN